MNNILSIIINTNTFEHTTTYNGEITNGDGTHLLDILKDIQAELTTKMTENNDTINKFKKGDLVIRKGKHEAKVYFIEAIDNDSILLVNGIQDELYSNEKDCAADNTLDYFFEHFQVLAKKENLEY